ncbi:hypothetical protein D3C85_1589020 [compost metagenome]
MSTAGSLAPCGRITSAKRLVGSMNWLCIGRTVARYCSITLSVVRPRSAMSRFRRRMKRTSASVSTKIFSDIISRSAASYSGNRPSITITGAGWMVTVRLARV